MKKITKQSVFFIIDQSQNYNEGIIKRFYRVLPENTRIKSKEEELFESKCCSLNKIYVSQQNNQI